LHCTILLLVPQHFEIVVADSETAVCHKMGFEMYFEKDNEEAGIVAN